MKARVLIGILAMLPVVAAQTPWREAQAGYSFVFPRDHFSHPDFKIEWWYYTGNLMTQSGRRFGYQVTFFRVGVDRAPSNPSRWAVRDLFMTHVAVSDVRGQRYPFDERLSRGGPGLAGAAIDAYRVWNDDWIAYLDNQGRHVIRASTRAAAKPGLALESAPARHASTGEAAVDLVLDEGKPAVINGVNGISQKGARAGNATHYYSLTRMPTRGSIAIDGERFEVAGGSWMDHEFGTTFLEPQQQGWDWVSLQLSDGRELMLYQFRREDGSRDPRSAGTLVDAQGRTTHLDAREFSLVPEGQRFRAPSGALYSVHWRVQVPGEHLDLDITTPLANQELSTEEARISYWEGLIDIAGTSGGKPITGRGYLEMTGYRGSLGRVVSQ